MTAIYLGMIVDRNKDGAIIASEIHVFDNLELAQRSLGKGLDLKFATEETINISIEKPLMYRRTKQGVRYTATDENGLLYIVEPVFLNDLAVLS